jgi:hypothetical protein
LLIIAAGFVSAVIMLYLFENYKNSGYMTGMERIPISENPFVLFLMLCKAQIIEIQNIFSLFFNINYALAFLVYVICAIICFRFLCIKRDNSPRRYIPVTAFSFLSVGLLYWISIVIMRFSADFDEFSYRLLFPASALFLLGIMAIIENRYSELFDKITAGLRTYFFAIIILLSSLSSFAGPVYKAVFKNEPINGYNKIRSRIVDELSAVPSKSLIINASDMGERYSNFIGLDLLYFIRPDLLYMAGRSPRNPEQIQGLLDKSKEVYIYIDWTRLSDNVNTSWPSFLEQILPGGTQTREKLMRIK